MHIKSYELEFHDFLVPCCLQLGSSIQVSLKSLLGSLKTHQDLQEMPELQNSPEHSSLIQALLQATSPSCQGGACTVAVINALSECYMSVLNNLGQVSRNQSVFLVQATGLLQTFLQSLKRSMHTSSSLASAVLVDTTHQALTLTSGSASSSYMLELLEEVLALSSTATHRLNNLEERNHDQAQLLKQREEELALYQSQIKAEMTSLNQEASQSLKVLCTQ
jgi:hypothetical protein